MASASQIAPVWDLRKAIADNAPRVGYVMDPYLDASIMKPTANELLAALHSAKRRNSHKDTDFLAFEEAIPVSHTAETSKRRELERRELAPRIVPWGHSASMVVAQHTGNEVACLPLWAKATSLRICI